MWECSQCGACCKFVKCKMYLDNKCSIYNDRPQYCRLSLYDKKYYEDMINNACNIVRNALKQSGG